MPVRIQNIHNTSCCGIKTNFIANNFSFKRTQVAVTKSTKIKQYFAILFKQDVLAKGRVILSQKTGNLNGSAFLKSCPKLTNKIYLLGTLNNFIERNAASPLS